MGARNLLVNLNYKRKRPSRRPTSVPLWSNNTKHMKKHIDIYY